MSLRKSSRRRKGSKSDVLPKPKARRRCTPAPSRVGLALMSRLTGRMDMLASFAEGQRIVSHRLRLVSRVIDDLDLTRLDEEELEVPLADREQGLAVPVEAGSG